MAKSYTINYETSLQTQAKSFNTMVNCAVIIAVRDEAERIEILLEAYQESEIDVVIIDNDSTDGTLEICKSYMGNGIIQIERQPWKGYFDLEEQLQIKKRLTQNLPHDWFIHADADEWLRPPNRQLSLKQAISEIDYEGYNCINFEEFVFLPDEHPIATEVQDYRVNQLYYYFFEPDKRRLMRAWKRSLDASNIATGGHRLNNQDAKVYPVNHVLRHYPFLSVEHAMKKYASRPFSRTEIAKGWHANRINIAPERFVLPPTSKLHKLHTWRSDDLNRTRPYKKHYWEWCSEV